MLKYILASLQPLDVYLEAVLKYTPAHHIHTCHNRAPYPPAIYLALVIVVVKVNVCYILTNLSLIFEYYSLKYSLERWSMYMYNYGIIQQGTHAVACIYTCVCIQLMICEFLLSL